MGELKAPSGWRAALAHAFSVEKPAFSAEDLALLDRLAAEVRRRGLQSPAVLFLESLKPLNFLGSQAMQFLRPMAGVVLSEAQWARSAEILERREALEVLIRRIEEAAPRA